MTKIENTTTKYLMEIKVKFSSIYKYLFNLFLSYGRKHLPGNNISINWQYAAPEKLKKTTQY